MERWQAKLLALFASFVLPLLVTMLPYRVSGYVSKKGKRGQLVLSYLMCFGGGIFFGTFLLHMGPEVHLLLNTSLLVPHHIQYPLADLLIGIGFFLVLFSEKFALKWNKRRTRNRSIIVIREEATKVAAVAGGSGGGGASNGATNGACSCSNCALGRPCCRQCGPNSKDPVASVDFVIKGEEVNCHGNEDGEGGGCRSTEEVEKESELSNAVRLLDIAHIANDDGEQQQQHQHPQHHQHSTRSIILIIALSMHRIFEGMTIGLQGSVHDIWSLFLAVMCHELVIGFSLGLQLVKSRLSLRQMSVTAFVCSAIMPLGVSVGIVLTELGGEGDQRLAMANGILQAVAMGTFIYVTFFEILQEEVDVNDTSLTKIIFIFAGFIMMALLDLIPEETPQQQQQQPVSLTTTTMFRLLGNCSSMTTTATTDVSAGY